MSKFLTVLLIIAGLFSQTASAQSDTIPAPLKVGVSIGIKNISLEKMQYAKSVGIDCINISLNQLVDKERHLKLKEKDIQKLVRKVKKITQKTGIHISAFHMPFGQKTDLSLIDETARREVVAIHQKLLTLCAPLHPDIVLFHPSWYLSLDQRQEHIDQLIKSVVTLKHSVKNIGAIMVIENMTGPELHVTRRGKQYERPLFRTVEETTSIMKQLPDDIYAAVDMNHILNPEKLVLALGNRLKFVHIADGDGAHERHYFPCSGKGMNNWMAIIDALYKAGYTGPFMYECHYKDMKDLVACYNLLYNKYIINNYIKSKYED